MLSPQKIRPDPSQPRSKCDPQKVTNLATSMVTKGIGVINPIEITDDYMIVTGETRWRAALEAGLKQVPCKLIEVTDAEERFLRQVVENIHQGTMNDWDTAKALKRLLDNVKPEEKRYNGGGSLDKGITAVAKKVGRSNGFVRAKLAILDESQKWVKAMKEGTLKERAVRAANRVPEAEELKERCVKGEFTNSLALDALVLALQRATPEQKKVLLAHDYTGMHHDHVTHFVCDLVPTESQKTAEVLSSYLDSGRDVLKAAAALEKALLKTPYQDLSDANRQMVVASLLSVANNAKNYLGMSFQTMLEAPQETA